MSHIYIYSPSSAVRDKAAFRRGVKRLQHLGHEVEIDEAALSSHMRFAGDDATRIAAIGRAAASGANVALISRGGYGLTRLLPELPYKRLAKAIGKGTQQDLVQARDWWQKAADAGHRLAARNLSAVYRGGAGVPADPKLSQKYLEQYVKSSSGGE